MRSRLAPSAERTAISFCRATVRDNWRLATFAQAISSTQPTAPSNRYKVPRTSPTTCSINGTMPKVKPPLGGYCWG